MRDHIESVGASTVCIRQQILWSRRDLNPHNLRCKRSAQPIGPRPLFRVGGFYRTRTGSSATLADILPRLWCLLNYQANTRHNTCRVDGTRTRIFAFATFLIPNQVGCQLPSLLCAGNRDRTGSIPHWQCGAPPFMRHPRDAVRTGFEPVVFAVTGQRGRPLP